MVHNQHPILPGELRYLKRPVLVAAGIAMTQDYREAAAMDFII
jgi:hypothetical protein